MTRRILLIPVLIATFFLGTASAYADSDKIPRKELDELTTAIDNSVFYRNKQFHKLDSLKKIARSATDRNLKWRKTLDISEEYGLLNTDSAIYYAEAAYRLAGENNDHEQTIESMLSLIDALSRAGIFTVAKSNYETVARWNIPDRLKTRYWRTGTILCSNMLAGMGADHESSYAQEVRRTYKSYCDSLLAYLPKTDIFYRQLAIDKMIGAGQYAEARKSAEELLAELPEDDRRYGQTALFLAMICSYQNDEKSYVSYLSRSATSDVKACVLDGMALPSLANWLYENGELDDAYRYVNYALEEATSSSSKMRTFDIAQLVPYIENAYKKKIAASHRQLVGGLILVAFLLVLTIASTIILLRQNRRSREAREELSKFAKVQESYVGNFIALCSNYSNRLESVNQLVGRKLSSGQADELLRMVKAGKLDSTDSDEDFNKLFDRAFLDMYPNFVTNINSLLQPDSQIELKDETVLTPELRIYAFVKLGVDESVKIAQILRYSVSTVYAYRNRMRNRATDRENFEKEVNNFGR